MGERALPFPEGHVPRLWIYCRRIVEANSLRQYTCLCPQEIDEHVDVKPSAIDVNEARSGEWIYGIYTLPGR